MIREDFLQQNAFLENDQYSSFDRQARLLELILRYKDLCDAAIARGADIWKLYAIAARAAIGRAKTVPAESYQDVYAQIEADMEQQIEEVAKGTRPSMAARWATGARSMISWGSFSHSMAKPV